jgi:hypothetical protein
MAAGDWRSALGHVGCAITLLVAVGCSKPAPLPGPQPFPVRGTVVYRGKPADGFRVAFHPLSEWEGPRFAPSGVTDAEGKFQLRSYAADDGAPAGDYAVTFTWPQEISSGDPDDAPLVVDRLKGALSNPRESQLKVTIQAGENVLEPFVLP